jgi:hypothetical protein
MKTSKDRARDEAAYRQLKAAIDGTYAPGRLVAIRGDRIVADAGSFEELDAKLVAAGLDPRETLVVEAAAEYPETAVIFVGKAAV